MSNLIQGFEVVCPDGHVRHFPYTNKGDALCDAVHYTERGCAHWKKGVRALDPSCPQGVHTIRPIQFNIPDQEEQQ